MYDFFKENKITILNQFFLMENTSFDKKKKKKMRSFDSTSKLDKSIKTETKRFAYAFPTLSRVIKTTVKRFKNVH